MKKILGYLNGFLDGTRSSTRLAGLSTTFAALGFAFRHPSEWQSIAAMLSGAAAFLGVRNLGSKPAPGAAPVSPSDNGSEEKP